MGECCRAWPPAAPFRDSSLKRVHPWLSVRLVAEFPHEIESDADAGQSLAIEEAILSLVRAVLEVGGTITLSADPGIAPFVAEIAAEYPGEARVQVAFHEFSDEVLLYDLQALPGVSVRTEGELDPPAAIVVVGAAKPIRDRAPTYVIARTGVRTEEPEPDLLDLFHVRASEYTDEELPFPFVMEWFVDSLIGGELR
jgi:hypothetical protein